MQPLLRGENSRSGRANVSVLSLCCPPKRAEEQKLARREEGPPS
jgi:hypothetical protein